MHTKAMTTLDSSLQFASLTQGTQAIELEYQRIAPERETAPLLVFLHEGLGSIAMWKDWPAQLCEQTGCSGLMYSRYGYGRSTPRPDNSPKEPDYLHEQSLEVLPQLLEQLGEDGKKRPIVLVGHSDGGSIALLAASGFSDKLQGIVVMAPHLFVEDISLRGILVAREAYEQGFLRERLGRYHDDVESAFWGWNATWTDPRFRDWNIEEDVSRITCPILAIQGMDDEYGTLEQIRRIKELVPHTELLELEQCGHLPYRDKEAQVNQAIMDFLKRTAR